MSRSSPLTRVLIVCEHASAKFGGEAVLPLQYFRILRRRGHEAWLIAHDRTRNELLALLPEETSRMHFLPDTWLNKLMWRMSRFVPAQIAYLTLGYVSRLSTQLTARALTRRLVELNAVSVVHQPIPVSPREPSVLHDVGAAVVIGPLNGNMTYPPAFARQSRWGLLNRLVSIGRSMSGALHVLMPGKRQAAVLLVTNARTLAGLPDKCRGEVVMLPENGVDLAVWFPPTLAKRIPDGQTRFVFMGRLVDWKAVDVLLDAVAAVDPAAGAHLEIVGDGPMRASLEAQVARLGLGNRVHFRGWQPQSECAERLRSADVLVLPSLFECGGAVVLEAMATGIPVIATAWGGPADYLDSSCGILVMPDSRPVLVQGFANAMATLASSPELRLALGQAGRTKAARDYSWDTKVDRMLEVYSRAATTHRASQSRS